MIYFKLFNLPNQTAQAGTVQNIKHRYHHHKASKNISDFYACYDLMEITTLSNLMALAAKISGLNFEASDAYLTEDAFNEVVNDIYDKIDILSKWETSGGEGDEHDDVDDESDDDESAESQEDEPNNETRESSDKEADTENEEDELLSFYSGLFTQP